MVVSSVRRSTVGVFALALPLLGLGGFALRSAAQAEKHGRGYKPLPPTAEVVVTVEKGFNEKPLPNASVIFRAIRDDKITANLETKTDPDGKASLDLLEVGSHVTIQVIANGFATYAANFDLTGGGKQLLVKLERPREQVSQYGENADRPAALEPGVQEHGRPAAPPPPSPPSGPQNTPQSTPQRTPPAHSPANPAPASPGSPQ